MWRFIFLVGVAVGSSGCVSWQSIASARALACAPEEVLIHNAQSANNRSEWVASCRGFTYACATPSGADDTSEAICHDTSPPLRRLSLVPLAPGTGMAAGYTGASP
jgi:hypothetical protein